MMIASGSRADRLPQKVCALWTSLSRMTGKSG
jgi:hypothetical protein